MTLDADTFASAGRRLAAGDSHLEAIVAQVHKLFSRNDRLDIAL